MLETRQGGAGDSLEPMWEAGLWQEWKNLILQSLATVYESTNNKLLWDFKIQTGNKIEHSKPDIVVLDKI